MTTTSVIHQQPATNPNKTKRIRWWWWHNPYRNTYINTVNNFGVYLFFIRSLRESHKKGQWFAGSERIREFAEHIKHNVFRHVVHILFVGWWLVYDKQKIHTLAALMPGLAWADWLAGAGWRWISHTSPHTTPYREIYQWVCESVRNRTGRSVGLGLGWGHAALYPMFVCGLTSSRLIMWLPPRTAQD